MSKLDVIRGVLSEKYKLTENRSLSEEEKDEKGKIFKQSYPIVGTPSIDYELYRFDKRAFPFFNDVSDLKKMCDYILFAEEKDHLYIFVIELKWGVSSSQKQLNAGREFTRYILNTAQRIGTNLDENYIHIRKVRLSQQYINKFNKRSINEKNAIVFDEDGHCNYPYNRFLLALLME